MRAPSVARLTGFAKRFARDEGGAVTVEAVIWIPFFLLILLLIVNTSFAFFSRAQAYRLIENANRKFSITVNSTDTQAEDYVRTRFATLYPRSSGNISLDTYTNKTSGTVTTRLTYRARDVVMFNALNVLSGWTITVQASQFVEWPLP